MTKLPRFKKQIKRINAGRQIDLNKICPHLGAPCIKDKCNAFSFHYEINIVSYKEKINHKLNDIDWEKSIIVNDWDLYAENKVADSEVFDSDEDYEKGLDEIEACDSLYYRRRAGMDIGRCLIK